MNNKNTAQNHFVFVLIFIFSFHAIGQDPKIWNKIETPDVDKKNEIEYRAKFKNFDSYALDKTALIAALDAAPFRFSFNKNNAVVDFPTYHGSLETFSMFQTEVMSPTLAEKFPGIKTYIGVSQEKLDKFIHLTITPFGVYGMIQENESSSYINPISYHGNAYMVFNKNQAYTDHLNSFFCEFEEQLDTNEFEWETKSTSNLVDDVTLKRFRLALSCTGEYANYHISEAGLSSDASDDVKKQAVLAAMVVTINRINSIYERDVAVTLQLIDNNDDLIQLDPTTDPFDNNDTFAMLDQNQTLVDAVIGNANYDIGHVFSTGGGGVASLQSVCFSNFKANGVTGLSAPVGDPFDIDYVAHEVGHQFGATHTYNNSCGGNRTDATAVEPGSGSTIMAYANICPPNVQSASDDYFHVVSVTQMNSNVSSGGAASFCAENIAIANIPPTIDVSLLDYIIPTNTAFFLEVDASDPNGDILTYCWEQLDNEISTQPPTSFNNDGPNFRSIQPSASPRRYFPDLNTVLNGDLFTTWERIPFVAREMEFGVLVRDNNIEGGQSVFENTNISFVSGGPFSVTSQNTTGIVWEPGETETITWNVANTDIAPVNTPEVDILLSTNVGQDFDVVLASGVPNNGFADITVPNVFGPSCRIMVQGSNSIFYALNTENFSINSNVELDCFDQANSSVISIPDGIGQDDPGQVVSSSIDFTQNIVIEKISAQVDITHTYIQDLVLQLQGPDGQFINLFDRNCAGEDGIAVEFDDEGAPIPDTCPNPLTGTYQPANGNFSQWIGTNAQGEWTLLMADFFNNDTGQLNSWSLEICTSNLSTINLEANQFSIVPNPNQGSFQINFSSLTGSDLTGKLYNLQGRLIEDIQLQPGLLRQEVKFENLQEGMYLFQINDGENTFVEKLLIR